jgi:CBS domain-containing protein
LKNRGRGVYSVAPDAIVHEALSLMASEDIGAVVVVADGELVGIVSAKDYGN